MRVLSRMRRLRRAAAAKTRRLLRVLLLRVGAVSTHPVWKRRLLCSEAGGRKGRHRMSGGLDSATGRGRARFADAAGVAGAVAAALCCAGTPFIVGALAAIGL